MEENHVITICNRQTINGETEEICLTTMGTYAEKGGNRYIIYQEYDQDANINVKNYAQSCDYADA